MAEYFGWFEWPFRITSEDVVSVWADRIQVLKQIDHRLQLLQLLPHSTIQLVWADLGAGKTHTLRYLQNRVREEVPEIVPVYTEVPSNPWGLHHVFQRLAASLPLTKLGLIAKATSTHQGAFGRSMDQAIRLAATGDPQLSELATSWWLAQKGHPHQGKLTANGIHARIETDDHVVEVLSELVARLTEGGKSLLWLVDECQRTAEMQPKKRDAMMRSLVSLFNSCQSGFHMMMSFSVGQQSAVDQLLPGDLRSRATTFDMMTLPFLSRDDAGVFLIDLFGAYRNGTAQSDAYPFTGGGLQHAVAEIDSGTGGRVTPRRLMESMSRLLTSKFKTTSALTQPIDASEIPPGQEWVVSE